MVHPYPPKNIDFDHVQIVSSTHLEKLIFANDYQVFTSLQQPHLSFAQHDPRIHHTPLPKL
jgi:hypothetical protein